jgi:hypothetical protein
MRKMCLSVAFFFLLTGCAEYRAKIAAQQAAEDDAKCISYGATRGDAAYIQCRAQLDAARTQAQAEAQAAVVPAQVFQMPADNGISPSVCRTSVGTLC